MRIPAQVTAPLCLLGELSSWTFLQSAKWRRNIAPFLSPPAWLLVTTHLLLPTSSWLASAPRSMLKDHYIAPFVTPIPYLCSGAFLYCLLNSYFYLPPIPFASLCHLCLPSDCPYAQTSASLKTKQETLFDHIALSFSWAFHHHTSLNILYRCPLSVSYHPVTPQPIITWHLLLSTPASEVASSHQDCSPKTKLSSIQFWN